MFYAVMLGGKCVAKIVWDGETPYEYPFPHDELVRDETNSIPVEPEEDTIQE
jgi:hypothetical protein